MYKLGCSPPLTGYPNGLGFYIQPKRGNDSTVKMENSKLLTELEAFLAIRRALEKIKTPVELSTSELLGLTEAAILKKKELDKLNPEPGHADKKWYSGGIREVPSWSGYIWSRCHILTFKDGKVVKHEMVDRPTAHVTRPPPEP